MCRYTLAAVVIVGLIGGCAQPQHAMEAPKKPNPAPELAKLQCWVGNWTGTSEMVSPSPEEMKKGLPEGAKEPQTKFAGASKYEWALGGMFAKSEGWYEMGEGQKVNEISFTNWDAKAKKYHFVSFNDWGKISKGWMTPSADGKTWNVTYKAVDADGKQTSGECLAKFMDDKTVDWTLTECGPNGTIKLKGTDKKQP